MHARLASQPCRRSDRPALGRIDVRPGTAGRQRGLLCARGSRAADLVNILCVDVSRTIQCALLGDALVLGSMLEEHGAQVRRADEDAPLTMVATGTLDGIRAAVAQLRHELLGAGPVALEGEDRDYGAVNGLSAALSGHIGEETPVADPAQSQAIPRRCSASTVKGSQCKLPAMPGDRVCAIHAEASLPRTAPSAPGQSRGPAELAAGAQPAAAGGGPATGALDADEWADPDQLQDFEVVIVPAEARYHRSGCTLIRLLSSDDLETLTRQEAQTEGYVPCRACAPDSASVPDIAREAIIDNVRAYRARRRLDQADVVMAMRALGYTNWHRQTMSKVERGERRLLAEEIIGLARVLATFPAHLLADGDHASARRVDTDGGR